jgi:hypothetical protein
MTTAYKVVRNVKGRLVSAIVDGPTTLEYFPGEWTEATVGGILVYGEENTAHEFAGRLPWEVWLAEVDGPISLPKYRLDICLLTDNQVKQLWDEDFRKFDPWNLEPWPAGTLAFKRCRLRSRLYSKRIMP